MSFLKAKKVQIIFAVNKNKTDTFFVLVGKPVIGLCVNSLLTVSDNLLPDISILIMSLEKEAIFTEGFF